MNLNIWWIFVICVSYFLLFPFAEALHSQHSVMIKNQSACKQPKAPGLCRGRLLRYAYDRATGNCVSFYYTGCASTDNNFLTFEECRRDCMQKIRY